MSKSARAQSALPSGTVTWTARQSLRRYYALGVLTIIAMVGGFGGWAAIAQISGGVIAGGQVTVEGNTKKVQHLEGGIVAGIHVRNADVVLPGQELVTLDGTEVRAQLQIVQSQLEELKARRARLTAERDGSAEFRIEIAGEASEAVRDVWNGQARLMQSRREAREAREQQQIERIAQLNEVVRGTESQRSAADQQMLFITEELNGLFELEQKQLVTKTKVLALQRERTRLEGQRGQFASEIARTNVQVGETRLQIGEQKQTFLSEVLAELREVETKLAELSEREIAVKSRLKRLSIVAPQAGVVHKLAVHTVGGVVAPGETVMEIVPQEVKLVVEGQLDPLFVEQVKPGMAVLLRLTAFDQQTTPELNGTVESVSADVRQDSAQGLRYYAVKVDFEDGWAEKLSGKRLVPGMPVELIIKRVDRTVLSFLVKPISDQVARVFRER